MLILYYIISNIYNLFFQLCRVLSPLCGLPSSLSFSFGLLILLSYPPLPPKSRLYLPKTIIHISMPYASISSLPAFVARYISIPFQVFSVNRAQIDDQTGEKISGKMSRRFPISELLLN